MNGRIYKIVNDVNDKVYVGKTLGTLEDRFKQHCYDSERSHCEKRPLYNAIQKYGKENFHIELIEECDSELLSIREQYWIGYYRGYEDGYNATRGGDGSILYNHSEIERLLRQGKTTKEIVQQIGCCIDVVYQVAKNCNIKLENKGYYYQQLKEAAVKVAQYDLDGNFIQSFDSYADAARWLYENNKIKRITGGVRGHIGEVCSGKRKTAYKYKWAKVDK